MNEGDVNALAKLMHGEPQTILRQGEVDAVTPPTISVRWSGAPDATPDIYHLATYSPTIGDTVWGIRDKDITIVLGTLET